MNKKFGMVVACLVIGALAMASLSLQKATLGRVIMGGPMVALLISMIICNLTPPLTGPAKEGTTFAGKKFLNWGIIFTGATLSFADLLGTGVKALPLLVLNLFVSFGVALWVGRFIGTTKNTSRLVGGGTAICGGTAIATLSPIVEATEEEFAFAMAAIFLCDTLAAFTYPYLAEVMHLTENQFAFWAGAAINDASSVAGAQATYSALSGLADFNGAINVKLVRTTLLIFVAIFMSARVASEGKKTEGESLWKVVVTTFPKFLLGFLVAILLNTLGLFNFEVFGASLSSHLGTLSKFLFASALAGVGFKISLAQVFSKGVKPILLGGCTWLTVCGFSLIFVFLFSGYVG
ncbi:MAG: putative sulfate exporter family transporter [Tissierellia bacterium]|nr:putative sulfate exporter family transporter [Tissierellia bacterium]